MISIPGLTFRPTRSCDLPSCELGLLLFANILLCYACDQETVKWEDGEAPITLREGHAQLLKSTVNYRDENLKKQE